MAFNILTDDLPTEWRGVPVKTDFRQVVKFYRLVADKKLSDNARAMGIIRLFFDKLPPGQEDVWDFIMEFIRAGGDDDQSPGKKCFDFDADHGRVYAAFRQAYGIDLTTERLHWWAFMELFRALPENTMLMRVIDIRTKEAPKNADREYLRALRKAKRAYAIKDESDDGGSAAAAALFTGA